MRTGVLLGLVVGVVAQVAHGAPVPGDKTGNGGGLWACRSSVGELRKAQLVDLYEAENEFGLRIPAIEEKSPAQAFLQTMESVSGFSPTLSRELQPHVFHIKDHLNLTNGELEQVEDTGGYRIRPPAEECDGRRWDYVQFANTTHDDIVLVQKNLWNHPRVSLADKAGLLVHEAVYRWLRARNGDRDSVRTRKITGLLLSDLAGTEKKRRIEAVLGRPLPNPGEDPNDSLGFSLRSLNENMDSILHRADTAYGYDVGTGNFRAPCAATGGGVQDILCILEVEELDLYFNELRLELNAPTTCEFVNTGMPSFFAYQPGKGPSFVEHSVHPDGRIEDGRNSRKGEPYCGFDYSGERGPNCCVGDFEHRILTYATDGTYTVATTQGSWNGDVSRCLAGPATHSAHFDGRGFPTDRLVYTSGTGLRELVRVPSAHNATYLGRNLKSNVFGANFYNPTEHSRGKPRALMLPSGLPAEHRYRPHDTYLFQCLNRQHEIEAQIRLMVREWNTPVQEGGTPDSSGRQPGFPESELNDAFDWRDFGDSFPGANL